PDFLGSLTLGLSTLLMGLVLFNLQVWGAGDGKLTAVLLFGIGPVSGQMALFINGCVVATLVTAAVLYYQKDQRRGLPFGIPLAFGYFLVLLT
ncbi:hypothetical protein KC722_02785, partial [Candidatus Kaiserbacteria bacterium]|nr:hypothetical protein [Candidatus Kaiserbacteria bacterium]